MNYELVKALLDGHLLPHESGLALTYASLTYGQYMDAMYCINHSSTWR